MGVTVAVLNDTTQAVTVEIQLRGGAVLASGRVAAGETWSRTDGGMASKFPYSLVVRCADGGARTAADTKSWIWPFQAPAIRDTLNIRLSDVVVPEHALQTEVAGSAVTPRERAGIAKTWISDDERTECRQCSRDFSLFVRKHHCRICGDIYCDHCSRFRVLTALHPTVPARACLDCYNTHKSGKDQSLKASKSSIDRLTPPPSSPAPRAPSSAERKRTSSIPISTEPEPSLRRKHALHVLAIGICGGLSGIWWQNRDSVPPTLPALRSLLGVADSTRTRWGLVVCLLLLAVVGAVASLLSQRQRVAPPELGALASPMSTGIGDPAEVAGDDDDVVEDDKADDNDDEKAMSTKCAGGKGADEEDMPAEPPLSDIERKWISLAEAAEAELVEWGLRHDAWTTRCTGDVSVFSRKIGSVTAFMGVGRVSTSPKKLYTLLCDVPRALEWNKAMTEFRVVRQLRPGYRLTHAVGAANGPISARDFVDVQVTRSKPDGSYVLAGQSIPSAPISPRRGIVRGENGVNGYVIFPIDGEPDACTLVWVVNANLRGWLLPSIIAGVMKGIVVKFYKNDLAGGVERFCK